MSQTPELSVVVPTLGRSTLVPTIESLVRAGRAVAIEVIVVGKIESSTTREGVQSIAAQYPFIRVVEVAFEHGDSSNKKNLGVRESSAPIVAFVDDDVVVAPDWPRQVLDAFADPGVGLVSGPSLVPDDVSLIARITGNALASLAAGYVAGRYNRRGQTRRIRWSGIIGCNMAFRRDVFEKSGGFDPLFWPGEEMIVAAEVERAGQGILFVPDMWLFHYPRASLRGFVRQMYGYGATRIRLMRAGLTVEPTTLLSMVGMFGGAALLVATIFWPVCGGFLAWGVAGYALFCVLAAVRKAQSTHRWSDLLIAFMVPIMHVAYGLGQWVEFMRPGKDLSVRGAQA